MNPEQAKGKRSLRERLQGRRWADVMSDDDLSISLALSRSKVLAEGRGGGFGSKFKIRIPDLENSRSQLGSLFRRRTATTKVNTDNGSTRPITEESGRAATRFPNGFVGLVPKILQSSAEASTVCDSKGPDLIPEKAEIPESSITPTCGVDDAVGLVVHVLTPKRRSTSKSAYQVLPPSSPRPPTEASCQEAAPPPRKVSKRLVPEVISTRPSSQAVPAAPGECAQSTPMPILRLSAVNTLTSQSTTTSAAPSKPASHSELLPIEGVPVCEQPSDADIAEDLPTQNESADSAFVTDLRYLAAPSESVIQICQFGSLKDAPKDSSSLSVAPAGNYRHPSEGMPRPSHQNSCTSIGVAPQSYAWPVGGSLSYYSPNPFRQYNPGVGVEPSYYPEAPVSYSQLYFNPNPGALPSYPCFRAPPSHPYNTQQRFPQPPPHPTITHPHQGNVIPATTSLPRMVQRREAPIERPTAREGPHKALPTTCTKEFPVLKGDAADMSTVSIKETKGRLRKIAKSEIKQNRTHGFGSVLRKLQSDEPPHDNGVESSTPVSRPDQVYTVRPKPQPLESVPRRSQTFTVHAPFVPPPPPPTSVGAIPAVLPAAPTKTKKKSSKKKSSSKSSKRKTSVEDPVATEASRRRQIDQVRKSRAYNMYIQKVPKSSRDHSDPITPTPATLQTSHRGFMDSLNVWKRSIYQSLHPQDTVIASPKSCIDFATVDQENKPPTCCKQSPCPVEKSFMVATDHSDLLRRFAMEIGEGIIQN